MEAISYSWPEGDGAAINREKDRTDRHDHGGYCPRLRWRKAN
jgi:hypothetical protein